MAAADQDESCRVCLAGAEPELGVNGRLISPCNCAGSTRHIHLRCLRRWQATQRAQDRRANALRCEICSCTYDVPQHILQEEAEAQANMHTVFLELKNFWFWLNDGAYSPVWQDVFTCWQNMAKIAGLYKGGPEAIAGLAAGSQVGVSSAVKAICCLARGVPGLMTTAILFPKFRVPFLIGSAVAVIGIGLGAVLATVSGAYCGALCGFCSGAVGFALWALKTHYETAAVGAKFAGLTFKAIRRIVLALGCHTLGLTRRRLM